MSRGLGDVYKRQARMLVKQARRLVTGKQLVTDKERLMY